MTITAPGHEDPAGFIPTVLGQPVWLRFEHKDAPRTLGGMIAEVTVAGSNVYGIAYELRRVPTLWRMSRRRNSRIFQDIDVVSITQLLRAEHHVAYRVTTARKYPQRAYCVQYEETDLAFISRLLAEEGIAYSFDHTAAPESTLVIVDSPVLASWLVGSKNLLFRRGWGRRQRRDRLVSIRMRPATQSSSKPFVQSASNGSK